jgi:diamine N-acetyltransferase
MAKIDYHIRAAGPDDAKSISELIQELARYEKLAHESRPDPAALRTHLDQSSAPYCEAILAIEKPSGRPVGFALFFPSYSTFLTNFGLYLEDLFVEPAFRKAGIGQALLARVVEIALERGCQRVEWSVLDWNELAIGFYRQLGATYMDNWTTMRLTGEALCEFGR